MLWPDPSEVLRSLAGSWTFRRAIDNGAAMDGIATFADRGNGRFDYREQGQFRLPGGQIIDAGRRYVFAENDRGFAVLFAETPPRLFHRVALRRLESGLVGEAGHLCGEDRYDSRYEFRADGSFRVEHAVIGPRKSYAIRTVYVRDSAGFAAVAFAPAAA